MCQIWPVKEKKEEIGKWRVSEYNIRTHVLENTGGEGQVRSQHPSK
jgi:hypothetical protein